MAAPPALLRRLVPTLWLLCPYYLSRGCTIAAKSGNFLSEVTISRTVAAPRTNCAPPAIEENESRSTPRIGDPPSLLSKQASPGCYPCHCVRLPKPRRRRNRLAPVPPHADTRDVHPNVDTETLTGFDAARGPRCPRPGPRAALRRPARNPIAAAFAAGPGKNNRHSTGLHMRSPQPSTAPEPQPPSRPRRAVGPDVDDTHLLVPARRRALPGILRGLPALGPDARPFRQSPATCGRADQHVARRHMHRYSEAQELLHHTSMGTRRTTARPTRNGDQPRLGVALG